MSHRAREAKVSQGFSCHRCPRRIHCLSFALIWIHTRYATLLGGLKYFPARFATVHLELSLRGRSLWPEFPPAVKMQWFIQTRKHSQTVQTTFFSVVWEEHDFLVGKEREMEWCQRIGQRLRRTALVLYIMPCDDNSEVGVVRLKVSEVEE